MMRLVYALGRRVRLENPLDETGLLRPTKNFNRTYNPFIALLLGAMCLIPQLVTGQCYTLECNQGVELKLDENCEGSVNPHFIIANNWSCQGPMDMTYFNPDGDTIGPVVTGEYIGQTLTVHVRHKWTGLTCWGSVHVVDRRGPRISAPDTVLACNGDPSVAAIGAATAEDNCGEVVSLTHQDSIIDFGCGFSGFEGYFAPDNWSVCLPANGDGGVDVTGAPETVLVEGASNSPLSLTPRYMTKFQIVIPAEGYVSFEWSSFGGSSFNTDAFYLTINNWCIQLTNDSIQSGSYTTGILHPGDVLSFEQASDGDSNVVNTLISNFQFHTMARKVIHRTWTATDEYGNTRTHTQVITLKRAELSQVLFPIDLDGSQAPPLSCGSSLEPDVTGFPVIDDDGDAATTQDQTPLSGGDCSFDVQWEDVQFSPCMGNDMLIRLWTITDPCSGNILRDTQLIRVIDQTPPQLTCPDMPVISTDDFSCFGTINLPQPPSLSDDCSPSVTVEPSWQFGTGFGPFTDIPPGTYTVTYTATDACGNASHCTTTLTLQDMVSPTVICDEQTVVALAGDGLGILHAQSLDDGTYDFCCIDKFEVKRKNDPPAAWAEQLYIDCDDLTAPLIVTLKVTDCAGNYGTCDVEVLVQDQLVPTITAPADVTVDCNADLADLSVYGQPQALDNCSFTITESIESNVTPCGQGTIVRTFTATDLSGNSASAQQTIHLVNLQPWNADGSQISWPADYSTGMCNADLHPTALQPPFDQPQLAGLNGCASVEVTWSDVVFWLAEPSCYQVLRTWKVVDHCQYMPGVNNDGIWEYTQTLTVLDSQAPQFIDPPTVLTFNTTAQSCTSDVSLPMVEVADCDEDVHIEVDGDLGPGFFFQNVPVGTYTMQATATDACGNSSQVSFSVVVQDLSPPQAACLNGLTVSLGIDGTLLLPANMLNSGSKDNCTPAGELLFSFSPDPAQSTILLTCDDLGQQVLTLYVSDGGGNQSSCQTAVLVLDPNNVCNPQPQGFSLGGTITTPAGQPVGGVTVQLSGVGIPPTITQPGTGFFLFENLPAGADLSVSPSRNHDVRNGVTTYDIVRITHHILGTDPFDSPWQFIAADVNGSGTITAADIVAIRSVILHLTDEFPNDTPAWRFVPADYDFPDPLHPMPFPQVININDMGADFLFADFIAIKMGDLNGSADPE